MIYCNFSDSKFEKGIKIEGIGLHIRNELAAILTELNKTPLGKSMVRDALVQCEDPEWLENYDENTERRNRA